MAAEKPIPPPIRFFVGVDVGTGSVRAGLFTESGVLRSHSRKEIRKWVNEGFPDGSYEQSTDNIWQAVCICVQVGEHVTNSLFFCTLVYFLMFHNN